MRNLVCVLMLMAFSVSVFAEEESRIKFNEVNPITFTGKMTATGSERARVYKFVEKKEFECKIDRETCEALQTFDIIKTRLRLLDRNALIVFNSKKVIVGEIMLSSEEADELRHAARARCEGTVTMPRDLSDISIEFDCDYMN